MPKMKPCTPETPKEEPYTVGMEQVGDKIRIRLYDETGSTVTCGLLAVIRADGTLHIFSNVNRDAARRAGIKLGQYQRIVFS